MKDKQALQRRYRLCYIFGSIGTLCLVGLLLWVAICIFFEKEPLAAVSFLPGIPSPGILVLIILVAGLSVFFWQKGADYHQRYEDYLQRGRKL